MSIEKLSVSSSEFPQSHAATGATPHATTALAFEGISLAEVEKRHILATLEHCKGNRTHAAKMLQVSIRTLRNKLREYRHSPLPDRGSRPLGIGES
jgi:DNA-binding NtrC family response regulator